MNVAFLCVLAIALQTGTLASRNLLQAPTGLTELPSATLTTPLLPPGSAPAPGPARAATCALEFLQNAGSYQTLIDLVDAASEGDLIAQILGSPDVQATLLAPTDAGIQSTLSSLGLTLTAVQADPLLITEILTYHLIPNILQESDIKDGYSFNTELTSAGTAQSVLVRGNGGSSTFVGKRSSAAIGGAISTSCKIAVIPLNGLLVPGA